MKKALFLVLLALGGCTTPSPKVKMDVVSPWGQPENMTQEQKLLAMRDLIYCKDQTTEKVILSGAKGMGMDELNELDTICLEQRGWRRVYIRK